MSALIAMQPLERLAWRWVLFNDKALAEIEGLDNCMTIRYEDLCVDPAGMTQRMFTFTGLTWCDETRRFLDQSIGKEKSGYYSLAKKPLRSAYKWRNELSAGDIDSIVAIARRSRAGRLFFEDRDGD